MRTVVTIRGMIGSKFAGYSELVAAGTAREDRNSNNFFLGALRLHIPGLVLTVIRALTLGAKRHYFSPFMVVLNAKLSFFSHISVPKPQFRLENR